MSETKDVVCDVRAARRADARDDGARRPELRARVSSAAKDRAFDRVGSVCRRYGLQACQTTRRHRMLLEHFSSSRSRREGSIRCLHVWVCGWA